MTWRKNRTFVIEHHMWAAVLWREARAHEVTNHFIAQQMGHTHPTVAQYALTGKSILTINRAMAIAGLMGLDRSGLAGAVEELHASLGRMHKNLKVLTAFPAEPPSKAERLLFAYQIEDYMAGQSWAEVFREERITPDDVWRARVTRGWSRWTVSQKMGLAETTIYHHERVNVPPARYDQYLKLYGDAL